MTQTWNPPIQMTTTLPTQPLPPARPIYICILDHPSFYEKFKHPLFERCCIARDEM